MNLQTRPKRTLGRLLARVLAVVLLIAGLIALGWASAQRWRPGEKSFPIQGVDVSHHQGPIEWHMLRAAGADFAYIKATEGATLRDEAFERNWRDSRAAGVRHGAYHFFTLCRSGSDQATNFIATVPREADALPPAVDLEFGGNCAARPSRDALVGEVGRFLAAIEAHAGKPAVLYVTREFEDAYRVSEAFDRPLWLRRLALRPTYGARRWAMWQASNIHRVDGIDGPVDWNVMRR